MPDYSTAADAALDAMSDNGELIEEYEISPRGRRVKRGKVTEQLEATIKLQALAARQNGGIFRLAKPKNPR